MLGSIQETLPMRRFLVLAALSLLAACATPGGAGAPTRAPEANLPSSGALRAIELGAWRDGSEASVRRSFAASVERSVTNAALDDALARLQRDAFTCRTPEGSRGTPPASICEHRERVGECTHTWQVLLYDTDRNAVVNEGRGEYDRVCASDSGLLGAPPG
jgi:hypothetical protein